MKLFFNIKELNINDKISVVLISLICLILPIFQKNVPLLIFIWALHSLLFNFKSFSISTLYKNKIAFSLLVFFVLHIITLSITENLSSGLFDIESKLSLVIFPVFFLFNPIPYTKLINTIIKSFILGCIVAGLICISHSVFLKISYDASWQYFTYTDLSILMHPTYFAMYLCLAIVISFQLFLKTKQKFNRFIYILVILFFLSLVLLLSSKAGLIVLLLIAISISIKYLKLTKRNLIIGILALCLFIGLLMKNDRFSQMNNSLYNHYILGKTQVESTNERLIVWGIVIQKLKTDWIFGTGAGDLKYDLTKEYKKNGFTIGEDKMLNAHNQYLETFLSVGILGLLNLVLIFYLTLKKYLAENNLILLGFILIISINFIFESILNNQAGIVFFSLFITMHAVIENNKSNVFKTID